MFMMCCVVSPLHVCLVLCLINSIHECKYVSLSALYSIHQKAKTKKKKSKNMLNIRKATYAVMMITVPASVAR